MAALHEVLPLRQCTQRMSARTKSPACALAELGKCPAPCELRITPSGYAAVAAAPVIAAVTADPGEVVDRLLARIGALAERTRYEEAARLRFRMAALLRAVSRTQRLTAFTTIAEVVAARPAKVGGWELSIIRHGRLVAAGVSPPGVHPRRTVEMLLSTAETVRAGPGPTPCASVGETERVLAWLERPEVRLVQATGGWAYPANGAARFGGLLAKAELATGTADPLGARDRYGR
jgi:DNA polymerase-3 subunit epsilon